MYNSIIFPIFSNMELKVKKNMSKIKGGNLVSLNRVTRKYGCSMGIIRSRVDCFTTELKKYPWLDSSSVFHKDLEVYTKDDNKMKKLSGGGYVVDAYDSKGRHRETIVCTAGMVRI